MNNETGVLDKLQREAYQREKIQEAISTQFADEDEGFSLVLPVDDNYTDGFSISVVKNG